MNQAKPKTLLTGRQFLESARWHEGQFYFCDWATREVLTINGKGVCETILRVPSDIASTNPVELGPLTIAWTAANELLVLNGRDRRLFVADHRGALRTLVDLSQLHPFTLNEIAVDPRGNIFLNGMKFGSDEPSGLIAAVSREGPPRIVADGLAFPNGMTFVDHGATLVVAESMGSRFTAFAIGDDGSLRDRRVWAKIDGFPDGITACADDSIWYADVPNQNCARVKDEKVIQTIALDQGCFSCALGGPQHNLLYILAADWQGFDYRYDGEPTANVLVVDLQAS